MQQYFLAQDIGEVFGDVVSKLFPNPESVIVQLLATAVMFFIVAKFFWKPIKKNIEKRKDYIKDNIEESNRVKQEAFDILEQSYQDLKDAHLDARRVREEAEIQARAESEQILERTNQEVLERKNKLMKEMEKQKIDARKEIHDEIVDISIKVAAKIIDREVNEEDNKKLVDEFLKDIKND